VVEVIFAPSFKKAFKKIKDKILKEKIIKHVKKLKEHPEMGKPMRYAKKGTREVYITPFRLSYKIEGNILYLLDVYHKDRQ